LRAIDALLDDDRLLALVRRHMLGIRGQERLYRVTLRAQWEGRVIVRTAIRGRTGDLRSGLKKRIAIVAFGAVVLAACSSGTSTSKPTATPGDPFNPVSFDPTWLAANVNASGSPVTGGTLKLEGSTDVSAALDPQGETEVLGWRVERAFTRQLVSYPASTKLATAESIVPDAAMAMPTVSADGLTYTFKIKSGVMWNTSPPRRVTSQDFKRGIERNCDPALAGSAYYYIPTIAGFSTFCTTFEGMDPSSGAAARAAYINGHAVSGIQTPDSSTIVFTLTQPATDFLNLLAMPLASAAPVEDLNYVPLTPGNPLYSDGPYQVSKYLVLHEIDLDHNPEWSQSTDTVRHDYVSNIVIKLDLAGSAAASEVQDDLTIGAADLAWDTVVPAEDIARLSSPAWNPEYGAFPAAGQTNPDLVFNVQSPNNNGALGNVKVRQALEYAINKVAMGAILSDPSLSEPLNQVIGPGAEGYVPFNDYPTPGNKGDPAKCRTLLRQAGVTSLTLKFPFSYTGQVYQEVRSDFGKCGVTVVGRSAHNVFFGPSGIGGSLKSGTWDITSVGWIPDWFGPTNGRAILPDLFYGVNSPGCPNCGGYENPAVDALVNKAEAALTLSQAASYWHQADEQVMADAAFIPFQTQLTPLFRSARVHNAIYLPFNQQYDITQVWLSNSP
jgi:ABC-type transport system substrate-binding protein